MLRGILGLKRNQHHKNLEGLRNKRLRKIVRHAYYHVPYYHFLFKKLGIRPDEIGCVADLSKLPLVSKSEFKQDWDKFVSTDVQSAKCATFTTSGTTGTPLRILKDPMAVNVESAMIYYSFFECGLHLTDRFLELTVVYPSIRERAIRHGPAGLMRGLYLLAINDPAENVARILEMNPTVINTFPTTLEYMIEEFRDELKRIRPRLVFTQGEKLTTRQRILVENCWNFTPNETYGSREFPRIAFECNEHQGLHVIDDWIILELLKDGEKVGPKEQGETIVTSLYNYAMPFIRYRLGDLARWSRDKCACGRSWPLLEEVEGRTMDYITLPSGKKILGNLVGAYIKIPSVKRYQIIAQQSKANILIKLILNNDAKEKDQESIRQRVIREVKLACLNEMTVDVKFVSAIPPLHSGKNPDLVLEP